MAIWDQLKGAAGKILSGIDSLEDRAREQEPSARARKLSREGGGPVELTGGVEDLPPETEIEEPPPMLDPVSAGLAAWGGELDPAGLDDPFGHEITEITEITLPSPESVEEEPSVGEFLLDLELDLEPIEGEVNDPENTEIRAIPLGRRDADDSDDGDAELVEVLPDAEEDESVQRFPNTLRMADFIVGQSLRHQHWPELPGTDLELLHELAVAELDLLSSGAFVGYALLQLVDEVRQVDEQWHAALLCTALMVHGESRELLAALRSEPGEQLARELTWGAIAAVDELAEIARATQLHDRCGFRAAVDELHRAEDRWELLVAGTLDEMRGHRPVEARGLHCLPGFRWA